MTTCFQALAVCMQSPCQVCPSQSMVTIGGLVGSAVYSVTVRARNGAGQGAIISSQIVSFKILKRDGCN